MLFKRRGFIRLLTGIICLCMVAPCIVSAAVNNGEVYEITTNSIASWPQGPDIPEETAVIMEASTGTVLYNKGMDQMRYPASITKIMTALVALEHSDLAAQVTFTQTGVNEVYAGSSNIQTKVGEVLTMEQCLYAILLSSANDASTQVAEYIGGSVENFVQMMNDKAAELGCQNTHFNNANGLPDENHYTTAYDMALISQAAIANETFRTITSATDYTIAPTNLTATARTLRNHHECVQGGPYNIEGCFGGKTGYTDAALNTLVTFVNRDDVDLICVLMRCDIISEFNDTKTLINYGFDNFERLSIKTELEVLDGGYVMVPKGVTIDDLEETRENQDENVKLQYTFQGQAVGSVTVTKESLELWELQKAAEEKQKQLEEEEKQQAIRDAQQKEEEEKQQQLAKEQHLKNIQRIIILVMAVIIVILLIVMVVLIVKKKKNKKR